MRGSRTRTPGPAPDSSFAHPATAPWDEPRRPSLRLGTGDSPCARAYYDPVAPSSKANAACAFVTPMAAVPVAELPTGDDWLYELKLDGSPYSSIVIDSRMSVDLDCVCPTDGCRPEAV